MKMTFHAILAGAFVLTAGFPAAAEAQPRSGSTNTSASTPHKVGLVDVGYIFDNYQKLKDQRSALQAEIQASQGDTDLASIRQEAQALKGQLEKVSKGSDKAAQIEQKLIELNAKGQARMASVKREFMRKEVKMYKEIYDEVSRWVEMYAEGQNYTLVLRYQRESPDLSEMEDPRAMMQQVNQLVVYHKGDDMTDAILNHMNEQYAKKKGQSGNSTSNRTATRPAAPRN